MVRTGLSMIKPHANGSREMKDQIALFDEWCDQFRIEDTAELELKIRMRA
jgi:hypothetical protein